MARLPHLLEFGARHGIRVVSIAELIRFRKRSEKLVVRVTETVLPTMYGDFRLYLYESLLDGAEHVALVHGDISGETPVLVRVHSECLTGDVLGSLRCDCGAQRERALEMIRDEGRGRLPLHAAGRAWHRADEQASSLPPAGRGSGHGGGESPPRVQAGRARLRDRRAGPRRSRAALPSGSSRTTRRSGSAWARTGWRWWSGFRWRSRRTRGTGNTWRRRSTSSATC